MARRGIDSTLSNIKKMIEDGDYYNAHLTCKSLAFRKNKKKEFSDAALILRTGCEELLKAKNEAGAADLGGLLIRNYEESQTIESEEIISTLLRIFSLFSTEKPSFDLLKPFVIAAINWSMKSKEVVPSSPNLKSLSYPGNPKLFTFLGEREVLLGDFVSAQKHLVKGDRPELLFELLSDWAKLGAKEEEDLFVTRVVLMYLCIGNLKDANIFFQKSWETLHSSIEPSPLLNFTRFLLLTLERQAFPLFKKLVDTYQPSLQRDPSFTRMLGSISEIYYNEKIRGGGLGDIFASLFNP